MPLHSFSEEDFIQEILITRFIDMTHTVQIKGPENEKDWSIDNFDPSLLVRIKEFFTKTNAVLGHVLPNTITLAKDGDPLDIAVNEESVFLNARSLDELGESFLGAALTHEGAHIKFGDKSKLFAVLCQTAQTFSCVNDLHDVFEESPESCCGMILKKFGSMDVFEAKLKQAYKASTNISNCYTSLNIDSKTSQAELAHRLIDDETVQTDLDSLGEKIKSWGGEGIKDFYEEFFAQTISKRKDRVGWEPFVDYESFLPEDEVQKATLLNRLQELHKKYVLPAQQSYNEIQAIEPVLLKAAEHRADNEIVVHCGAEAATKLLDVMDRQIKKLPPSDREACEEAMLKDHPSLQDRKIFVQARNQTLPHVSSRPSAVKKRALEACIT